MKLCKDCKFCSFYQHDTSLSMCLKMSEQERRWHIDPITGDRTRAFPLDAWCKYARRSDGHCGPNASAFEPLRPATSKPAKPALYQRLARFFQR